MWSLVVINESSAVAYGSAVGPHEGTHDTAAILRNAHVLGNGQLAQIQDSKDDAFNNSSLPSAGEML
jgi:hypothetical protein